MGDAVVVVRRDIFFISPSRSSAAQIDSDMVTGRGELFLGAFAEFSFNSVLSASSWISWRRAGAADRAARTDVPDVGFGSWVTGLWPDAKVRDENDHRAVQDQDGRADPAHH